MIAWYVYTQPIFRIRHSKNRYRRKTKQQNKGRLSSLARKARRSYFPDIHFGTTEKAQIYFNKIIKDRKVTWKIKKQGMPTGIWVRASPVWNSLREKVTFTSILLPICFRGVIFTHWWRKGLLRKSWLSQVKTSSKKISMRAPLIIISDYNRGMGKNNPH